MKLNIKLITLHFAAETLLFIDYVIMGCLMYSVYRALRHQNIPFKGFLWLFSIGSFISALSHFMGVLNLFVTYYWLDAVIKFSAGFFGIGTVITFMKTTKEIKNVRSPQEYERLSQEIKDLKKRLHLDDEEK